VFLIHTTFDQGKSHCPDLKRCRTILEMKIGKIAGAAGRAQMSVLLDRAFPVPAGAHFFDDFPIWDEEIVPSGGAVLRLGAFEGEKLLSCAAIRVAELKIPGSTKRLACAVIGAVATAEDARGQGHASLLVEELERAARQERVSLLLLWGSEHSMYRRLGFELCGRQAVARLARLPVGTGTAAAAVRTGWVDGLWGCLARRDDGLALTAADRAWVGAHRNVEWFWTGSAADPSAWAAIGRGIDLGGYVHEWGGDPAALMEVLGAVQARHPQALVLGSERGIQALGLEPDAVEGLCLAKVLDPATVLRAYRPSNLVQAEHTSEGWQVACGSARFSNLTDSALSLALFGSPSQVDTSLNLPLWVWGLDAG